MSNSKNLRSISASLIVLRMSGTEIYDFFELVPVGNLTITPRGGLRP